MSYHHILVHVDNARACPARIAAAVALARDHGAKLHGCCVVPALNLSVYADAPLPAEITDRQLQILEADLRAAEKHFTDAVSDAGIEWECTSQQGRARDVIAAAACYADLTVVGKRDVDDPKCTSSEVAETLLFQAGSAALVVPVGGVREPLTTRVAVGWNGSRQAQRAVQDAFPLLEKADHVDIICVLAPDGRIQGRGEDDANEPAAKLRARLSDRGIPAHPLYVSRDHDEEGVALMDRCAELGASVLVLGAYGHSRFREFLLGGVTRSVLYEHRMPILLSH